MLRVQLLNKHRAEEDYASSRVSVDKRQVPWLLSPAERKALPIGVLRKLRQLEREEERARKKLPGSISKLVKGYELRMWWFEVSSGVSNRLPLNCQSSSECSRPLSDIRMRSEACCGLCARLLSAVGIGGAAYLWSDGLLHGVWSLRAV